MNKLICSFLPYNDFYEFETEAAILKKVYKTIDYLIGLGFNHFIIGRFDSELEVEYAKYTINKKKEKPSIIVDMVLIADDCPKFEYIYEFEKYCNNVSAALKKNNIDGLWKCSKTIIDKSNFILEVHKNKSKITRQNMAYRVIEYSINTSKTIKFLLV